MSINNLFKENDYKIFVKELGDLVVQNVNLTGAFNSLSTEIQYNKVGKLATVHVTEASATVDNAAGITFTLPAGLEPVVTYVKKVNVVDNNSTVEGTLQVGSDGVCQVFVNIDSTFTAAQTGGIKGLVLNHYTQ